MSTTPQETKRQLAGRKTATLNVPMMPAQKEAVEAALTLIQGAVNDMLVDNLAGETGPAGFPSQLWIHLNAEDPAASYFTLALERVMLVDTPSIVEATEADLRIIRP